MVDILSCDPSHNPAMMQVLTQNSTNPLLPQVALPAHFKYLVVSFDKKNCIVMINNSQVLSY